MPRPPRDAQCAGLVVAPGLVVAHGSHTLHGDRKVTSQLSHHPGTNRFGPLCK